MGRGFEFIDHTADYAVRAWGADLRELIEHAAEGLIRLTADLRGIEPDEHCEVVVGGDGAEAVLVHALKEILLLVETGRLPVSVSVSEANADGARMRVGTTALEPLIDRIEANVKAVTYHDLEIVAEEGGLTVEVVFDT